MDESLDITTLLRRMWTVVSLSRGPVLLFVGVVYALILLQDFYPDAIGLLLLAGVVGLAANYLLLRSMLHEVGLKRVGEGGGFGSYFGVGILSGLGVMLGLILFVIPGIVLMVRWLPADAMVLSEDNGASDALGESWQMTAEHFWPLLVVALLGLIPSLGSLVEAFASAGLVDVPLEGLGYEIVHQLANAMSAVYPVYSISLSVAAYWLLRGDRRTIEEVFA